MPGRCHASGTLSAACTLLRMLMQYSRLLTWANGTWQRFPDWRRSCAREVLGTGQRGPMRRDLSPLFHRWLHGHSVRRTIRAIASRRCGPSSSGAAPCAGPGAPERARACGYARAGQAGAWRACLRAPGRGPATSPRATTGSGGQRRLPKLPGEPGGRDGRAARSPGLCCLRGPCRV